MRREPVVTKFSQIEGSGLSTFLYVGMDVHKNSIEVAIAGSSGLIRERFSLGGDLRGAKKLVKQKLARSGQVRACYEAGPTGYGLKRRLEAAGIPCMVVAPSMIPKKPGERIRTGWLAALPPRYRHHHSNALVSELHGFERFRHVRQLMAFLGLTPSEHSSGTAKRRGAITKDRRPTVSRALSRRRHR